MVVKHQYGLYSTQLRRQVGGQILYELLEIVHVGGVVNLIIEALILNALSDGSIHCEGCTLHPGSWHCKALFVVEPSLLLDHVTSEGSLVQVNYRVLLKDVFGQSHCELVPAGLKEILVMAMWVVLGVGRLTTNIVPRVEELKFVLLDRNTVLVLNLLASLHNAQVCPVIQAFWA